MLPPTSEILNLKLEDILALSMEEALKVIFLLKELESHRLASQDLTREEFIDANTTEVLRVFVFFLK